MSAEREVNDKITQVSIYFHCRRFKADTVIAGRDIILSGVPKFLDSIKVEGLHI